MGAIYCIHNIPIDDYCPDCDDPVTEQAIKDNKKSCPECGTNMVKQRSDWFCNHCGHTTCGSC